MKHISDGASPILRKILNRTCFLCHDEWQMTCEEYVLNEVGRKLHDFSQGGDLTQDEWICPNCSEKIIRIKNL